jgi:hypothetical protein
VIIVVEGASGAGKTTWCRTHGGASALLEALPDHATVPTEPEAAATFWVERNVARWQEVLAREAHDGLVVVDTDPFKLHFVWTLFRTGQVSEIEWTTQRDVARAAFATGRYALADVFLVSNLDEAALRAQRENDPTRTRRNFERHVLLRDSLLSWYSAIDRLEPGRVVFGLPSDGITPELIAKGKRTNRSGLDLFEQLMSELAIV